MIFLNLTNGLEAIEKVPVKGTDLFHLVRIQSTWCEQKRWKEIILDLDYTFLMACRILKNVTVIDFSARKPVPRALYQGLAWIEYVLNRYWYDIKGQAMVKGTNCEEYFEKIYQQLLYDKTADALFAKLRYFNKFKGTGQVKLDTISSRTEHDGDYSYYNELVSEWNVE